MKESLINFDTAKLAKEKGFKLKINPFGFVTKFYEPKTGSVRSYGLHRVKDINNLIYASTQTELQKWLREVYNKHIQIALATNPRKCFVYFIQDDKGVTIEWNTDPELIFDTYEEALEIGLQKALEMI